LNIWLIFAIMFILCLITATRHLIWKMKQQIVHLTQTSELLTETLSPSDRVTTEIDVSSQYLKDTESAFDTNDEH